MLLYYMNCGTYRLMSTPNESFLLLFNLLWEFLPESCGEKYFIIFAFVEDILPEVPTRALRFANQDTTY